MKYRKKPVIVDVCQWLGPQVPHVEFIEWIKEHGFKEKFTDRGGALVFDLHGIETRAKKGDWIIKGVNGEFYPCKPDIFEKTYEKVC